MKKIILLILCLIWTPLKAADFEFTINFVPADGALNPPGTINSYIGSTPPAGWLFLHGQTLSTTEYPALFQIIGYTYGGSGGSFRLPDTRGLFVRSAGSQVVGGVTHSGSLGQIQAQDWKSFTGTNTVQNGFGYSHNNVYMGKSTSSFIGNLFTGAWSAPASALGIMWDSSENRPGNISFNYMIKY